MTPELRLEVEKRTTEIVQLEQRLAALQISPAAPVADDFDSATEFMQAMRDHHAINRDRLDEVAAIEEILPIAKAKLSALANELETIRIPCEKHFEEMKAAALEANKTFIEAETAYRKVMDMAQRQAELGHSIIFGTTAIDLSRTLNPIVFAISDRSISCMSKQAFIDYQRSGNVGAGTRIE